MRPILCSPSYRQADEDVDFLQRNDTRGVRLHLDYLKAERLLEDHNIAHTINGFSAHADQRDLLSWHGCVKGKAVTFLVHGEELVMEKFANRLQRTSVTLPKLHQPFDL